jgi:endonuclease/exonuclease/phosphatase family metal-dependent hydrolase
MGDFNAAEDNPALAELKKDFVDTFRVAHPDEKLVNTFSGFTGIVSEGRKIDHIFIVPGSAKTDSAEIVRYRVDGRDLSDHYPVRAGLTFK